MISAVVLTKNEEKNIRICLDSLSFVDEIVVIDDHSTDQTTKIIKTYFPKVKIFVRALDGNFAGQHNFGLENATGDWVLFIDADETVSTVLAEEIKVAVKNDSFSGYFLKRQDLFLGKTLHFGETDSVNFVRLAKKGAGEWKREVHEYWKISGRIGQLKNPLLHSSHQSITEFISKINFYTSLDAIHMYKTDGIHFQLYQALFNPKGKFLQNFFLRLGFLDGLPGFEMAFMMSVHSLIVRVKLYELALHE